MRVIRLKETKLLQNFLLERKISEGLGRTRLDLRLHFRQNQTKKKKWRENVKMDQSTARKPNQ